jgi:hypothetical protein
MMFHGIQCNPITRILVIQHLSSNTCTSTKLVTDAKVCKETLIMIVHKNMRGNMLM